MNEVCRMHEQEVGAIREIQTDIKWIRTFGALWLKVVGTSVVLLVPLMVTFFVFQARLDSRVSALEKWKEKVEGHK